MNKLLSDGTCMSIDSDSRDDRRDKVLYKLILSSERTLE